MLVSFAGGTKGWRWGFHVYTGDEKEYVAVKIVTIFYWMSAIP